MPDRQDTDPSEPVDEPQEPHPADATGISSDVTESKQANRMEAVVEPPDSIHHGLWVVGLGGSAGSLVSLQRFFAGMPVDTGMAFVVVIHLAPDFESSLAGILQRSTKMPVVQVTGQTKVEPDHVYVIPPGKQLLMNNGHLSLADIGRERGKRVTVDLFFRSLADGHGLNAVAIVLSGADSDGAIGIKRIKERGGLTIVQDTPECEHSGMLGASLSLNLALQAQQRATEKMLPFPPIGRAPESGAGYQPTTGEPGGIAASDLHFRLIERFSPPSLVVNQQGLIVHLSPNVGRFLQFQSGELKRNVLHLVHPMLRAELRAALFRASDTTEPIDLPNVFVEFDDGTRRCVDISVRSAPDFAPGFHLVVFNEREAPESAGVGSGLRSPESEDVVRSLERELEAAKQNLRTLREEHSATTEEMKASNEELHAMNEELRSASEELETSREELQSINEELVKVNQDLKTKVDELARSNSDTQNLMTATNVATLFLDGELKIKRYTASAVALFHLVASDVGRPLVDLRHRLEFDTMIADAGQVLRNFKPIEREVRSSDSRWFLARTIAYRTAEDLVEGVVLTFVDISKLKEAELSLRKSKENLERRVSERTVDLDNTNRSLRTEIEERKRAESSREEVMRALVAAQEMERGRISRELHDEIGQHITALLFGLKSLESELKGSAGAATTLRSLQVITENLGREIHEVAVELRPTSLDDLGLARALSAFLEDWAARSHLTFEFDHAGLRDARLPAHLETALYRVVCESVHNVVKHAGATRMSIVIQEKTGWIVAIVEDNGVGYDVNAPLPAGRAMRLGIVGMKERVALLNGELTIESEPGHGTTVIVRLPLAPDESKGQNE